MYVYMYIYAHLEKSVYYLCQRYMNNSVQSNLIFLVPHIACILNISELHSLLFISLLQSALFFRKLFYSSHQVLVLPWLCERSFGEPFLELHCHTRIINSPVMVVRVTLGFALFGSNKDWVARQRSVRQMVDSEPLLVIVVSLYGS